MPVGISLNYRLKDVVARLILRVVFAGRTAQTFTKENTRWQQATNFNLDTRRASRLAGSLRRRSAKPAVK